MCYTVCMANTKHVTVRLSSDLVAEIDRYGLKVNRSRSYLIEACLKEIYELADDDTGRKNKPGGDGTELPILPNPESEQEHRHSLQPLRSELAPRHRVESRPKNVGKTTSIARDDTSVNYYQPPRYRGK